MKRTGFLIIYLLVSICAIAQVDSINQRIILIGDAGVLVNDKHPVVDWVRRNIDLNDEKNSIVYLGDNIYAYGLPMEGDPTHAGAKKVIDYQMNVVRGKKAKAFFVMGNHDWMNGKIGGWQQAINQINYINSQEQKNIVARPIDGCPGPEFVELSDKVVLVMMDSQWFLHLHDKPGPGSNCTSKSIDEFATELKEILATHPNHLVVLAMHHPMYTLGTHGGVEYTWKDHLFPLTALNSKLYIPLPVLGSVYPIARGVFGNIQDTKHPLYQTMINTIEDVIKEHPNVIPVAGHDHCLQLIEKDSIPYIVSGSGAKLNRVKRSDHKRLLFAESNFGLATIEVRKSGKVELKYFNVQSPDYNAPVFTHSLKTLDTLPTVISKDSIPVLPDSIVVAANRKLHGTFLRNTFLGKNYRKEWTTPIKVQVLDLGKEAGGLIPQKRGGGKQTISLQVTDKQGREWALRSVAKYPDAAIPPDLRSPFARNVIEQGVSASYPYASLSTEILADAAGVPTFRRKLVYVPDDPRLGRFRAIFKNTLAIMELREIPRVKKTYDTEELVVRLEKDNDDHVDQVSVLKARLLDNFYMDLDRHEGQWRWTTRDTGRGKIYYVIPRDQDQAFFTNQGIIPKIARRPWYIPELQGFRPKALNIKTFNRTARNFDRFFLNQLDKSVWEKHIDTLLSAMTDDVIDRAMAKQPQEIRKYHANAIGEILKKRRQHFKDDMLKYYDFISKEVTVVGTNQKEFFVVDKLADGSAHVTMNKIDKNGNISSLIYDRTVPSTTDELRIFGLQGDDSILIKGGDSPIKIRIVGGSGKDDFINEGTAGRVLIYDVTFEENTFSGNVDGLRRYISDNPLNNLYNRNFYKYNYVNPSLSFGYNIDDGVFLGYQAEYIRQIFRKEPYGQRHFVQGRRAMKTASTFFHYEGDFMKAVGNSDLLLRADIRAPVNITNFFGLGNNTEFDKSGSKTEQYYRARYDIIDVAALLRRQLQSWMRVNYGVSYQSFRLKPQENIDRFVSNAPANGLDPSPLYKGKNYLGPYAFVDINSRNNRAVPTRGLNLYAGARSLFGLNGASNNVTQLNADISVVASFEPKAILVYGLRFGAGHNIGKYEFQQAQYLSGTENLRGYRRNRFGGRSMLYNNAEVRIKLAEFSTYFFPGQLGILVFNDVGRVWADGEKSSRWHVGNGFGVWVAPVRRFVVTAQYTRSKEEKGLPLVTFGFQF
jgi:hypothetical protein